MDFGKTISIRNVGVKMAKKKEGLKYLNLPLPEVTKSYRLTRIAWSGLNKRQTMDTGVLSYEKNISTKEAPYLTPSCLPEIYYPQGSKMYWHPVGMFGFDNFLIVIYEIWKDDKLQDGYEEYGAVLIDYINTETKQVYTSLMHKDGVELSGEARSVVQFNVYDDILDPTSSGYTKKLLIFPDRKTMDFEITTDNFKIQDAYDTTPVREFTPEEATSNDETEEEALERNKPPEDADKSCYYQNTNTKDVYAYKEDEGGWVVTAYSAFPAIKYAAVHLSRLFGVDDTKIYASGFNDYTNWFFDTIDEYNESNAWMTSAQSNTKAGGNFTGITSFGGHIVCFKKDFMHEIYNTKNPFRLQDIFNEGCIDNRSIQDVDGKLIYVADDDVKIYTGSNPREIGYPLGIKKFKNAVSGTDGRNYYLYCTDEKDAVHFFVYDTFIGQWSEQDIGNKEVKSFAHTKNGMFALVYDNDIELGYVYKLDSGIYTSGDETQKWEFETDLITNKTVDIKHLKKIQMLADISKNAYIDVYALYDGEEFDEERKEEFQLVFSSRKKGKTGKCAIRVLPRKSAHYGIKLHFEGEGFVRLYEMELSLSQGGNIYE